MSSRETIVSASPGDSKHWWLCLAIAIAVTIAINPIGFMGGGWDDWHYLDAARCWREYGPCLAHNHWQGRWPVIAPLAAVTALLGESRLTVGLAPLAFSIACLILIARLGNRLAGRPAGFVAALLFLTVPAFSIQLLDPTVEAVELGFCLAGLTALLNWRERPGLVWPLVTGLMFGLAFQVRETAAVAIMFAAGTTLAYRTSLRWPQAAAAMAGLLAPLIVEFVVMWLVTGDPLWRRRLALAHAQIPSTELLGPVDPRHSPLFNPAYIANWRREPGVHIHWLVDGYANLFANAKAGILLGLVPMLLLVYRRAFEQRFRVMAWYVYATALAYMAVLIYALAIDPKARMMFLPLAALALVLGAILVRLAAVGRRAMVAVVVLSEASTGLFILFIHHHVYPLEKPAAEWIAQAPGQIEATENTRRHLALVPSVNQISDPSGTRPLLMIKSDVNCNMWIDRAQEGQRLALVAHVPMSRGRLLNPRLTGELCLFKVQIGMTANELNSAAMRADWYAQEAAKAAAN